MARVDFSNESSSIRNETLDIAGVDLTDEAACGKVITQVVKKFGGIDVLVNVAGGFGWDTLSDSTTSSWQQMFSMNVLTATTITRSVLPTLKESAAGRVVNVGANSAIQAGMGMGAYAASKAGVHRFTESLAAELMGSNVTANAVLPTVIDTPANRADMPHADFQTWVKPAAVADAIMFLASEAARGVNGALLTVGRGTPH